jgi:hypothetical protein
MWIATCITWLKVIRSLHDLWMICTKISFPCGWFGTTWEWLCKDLKVASSLVQSKSRFDMTNLGNLDIYLKCLENSMSMGRISKKDYWFLVELNFTLRWFTHVKSIESPLSSGHNSIIVDKVHWCPSTCCSMLGSQSTQSQFEWKSITAK